VRNSKRKRKVVIKTSTSKALTNFTAMSEISRTAVSIFLLVLRARVLLSPPFLLSVDKGRSSERELIMGPCMIEEIEGALWPIYGARLGGQYRIDLPLLLTIGGSVVSGCNEKGIYNKYVYDLAMRKESK
jgi:hypothetical protein